MPSTLASPRTDGSRWRRLGLRLGLSCFGALIALALMEVGLRCIDLERLPREPLEGFLVEHERIGWHGASDRAGRFVLPDFDVEIAHDERGFRRSGAAAVANVPADAPRVVLLGDSFTWGWGVSQGETLADRLQAQLGARARIENRGVNGYGTGQELLLLEDLLAEAVPRIVVVLFYENDLRDNTDERGGRRPIFRLDGERLVVENCPIRHRTGAVDRFLMHSTRVVPFLRYELGRLRKRPRADDDEGGAANTGPARPHAVLEREWALERALLAAMRDCVARAGSGCELRLVYVPRRGNVETAAGNDALPSAASEGAQRFVAIGAELGIPTLDLTPALRAASRADPESAGKREQLYFPSDPHWTAAANAVAARALLEAWTWP